MANLLKRAQKKAQIVLFTSLAISTFFIIEIVLIFYGGAPTALSLVIGITGVCAVVVLQFAYFKERKYLVQNVIQNLVDKKAQAVDGVILNRLLKEDFSVYLRKAHVFVPRDTQNRDELSRVEGLSSFIAKHKTYAELNLLEEFSEEILKKNNSIKVSAKELSVDIALFLVPTIVVQLSLLETGHVLIAVLVMMRGFTWGFYFKQYLSSKTEKFNIDKIEHFLFGDFDGEQVVTTRLDLNILKETESKSVFFLIDSLRKNEVEKLIRTQISGDRKFKDWPIISAENSVYKGKVKGSKAFIFFPSEMLFPFEEVQEFISAFDEVIIVDSSPSYAVPTSAVFYLDHDQEVKRVHLSKNVDRLSGDKGLILRSFKRNNLDSFLTQIEKKIIAKEHVYLIYGDAKDQTSCKKTFVYPSGVKMVSISNSLEGVDSDYYCDLGLGSHREKLERAKSFVANCSYHKIYFNVMIQKKLKNSFRAS